ncbi:TetR family transcriptional regulator [Aliihoeflea sp. 40Bstr573]|uniref:TetR/AcrR family transcriptional regulator n=1 Tax=Aliihoeflea sp. 40Bstr573 TaxID=2696467 RepID=UPI002095236F
MSPEKRLAPYGDYSLQAAAARILERNRDHIRTQKPHIAVAKLSKIIEATLKLSNRQGFQAMSLRDLAAAAGLSMGGLYSYFDGKDTLLVMILGEVSSAAEALLEGAPSDIRADPVAHLEWLIDMHVCLSEVMQPFFVFAYMEAKSFPAPARKRAIASEAATEAIFAKVLAEGVAKGKFTVADPDFAAALIKPLLQDWYVKRPKYARRGVNADVYAAGVADFVLKALGAR